MAYTPIIKICGIRTPVMLEAAIEAGADMVGFMHFPRSVRHCEIDAIAELISEARGRVQTCVVAVNPDNSMVAEIAALDPDWLQLHGPETPHRVEVIRAEAGLAVIKVIGVADRDDLKAVAGFADIADRIMLDTKAPKNTDLPGGRGVAFDWSILDALDEDLEFTLAGGLTPETVADAVKRVRPFGLDVSSGVESAPGQKDADKIKAFIANARKAAEEVSAS